MICGKSLLLSLVPHCACRMLTSNHEYVINNANVGLHMRVITAHVKVCSGLVKARVHKQCHLCHGLYNDQNHRIGGVVFKISFHSTE